MVYSRAVGRQGDYSACTVGYAGIPGSLLCSEEQGRSLKGVTQRCAVYRSTV